MERLEMEGVKRLFIVKALHKKNVGSQQWWAKLLRLLTVNSLSYFVKIKY